MKVQFLILGVSIFLISCSKSEDQKNSIKISNLVQLVESPIVSGDFGETTSSVNKNFTIKNTGDEPSEITSVEIEDNPSNPSPNAFLVYSTPGCNASLTNSFGSTCKPSVRFLGASKNPGSYSAILKVGSSFQKTLTAQIPQPEIPEEPEVPPGGQSPAGTNYIYTIDTSTGDVISPSTYSLGESVSGTINKSIYIKNTGTNAGSTTTAQLSNTTDFSLINYCLNKRLGVNGSCYVKIVFSAASKSPNTYSTTLSFDGSVRNFTATVLPTTTPAPTGAILQLFESDGLTLASSVDFGEVSSSVNKTYIIKNTGSASMLTAKSLSQAPSTFTFISNGCLNKKLGINASCSFRLAFSNSGKTYGTTYSSSLTFDTLTTQASLDYVDPNGSPGGSSEIQFLEGVNPVTSSILGPVEGNNSSTLTINIKNNGSSATASSTATLNNSNFSFVTNGCINRVLNSNATCQVRVSFTAYGKSPNTYLGMLSFAGANLNLSATVNELICQEGFHVEDYQCKSNERYCPTINLPPNTSTGIETWNGSEYGPCIPQTCMVNYHIESNQCLPNNRPCQVLPANALEGNENWNGSEYEMCIIAACEEGYELDNNSCVAESSGYALSPQSITVNAGELVNFTVLNGVPPYVFTIEHVDYPGVNGPIGLNQYYTNSERNSYVDSKGRYVSGINHDYYNEGIDPIVEKVVVRDANNQVTEALVTINPDNQCSMPKFKLEGDPDPFCQWDCDRVRDALATPSIPDESNNGICLCQRGYFTVNTDPETMENDVFTCSTSCEDLGKDGGWNVNINDCSVDCSSFGSNDQCSNSYEENLLNNVPEYCVDGMNEPIPTSNSCTASCFDINYQVPAEKVEAVCLSNSSSYCTFDTEHNVCKYDCDAFNNTAMFPNATDREIACNSQLYSIPGCIWDNQIGSCENLSQDQYDCINIQGGYWDFSSNTCLPY